MPTLSGAVVLLLFSLPSEMRFTSSTQACTVCAPDVALQVECPCGPLLAVSVTLAPGASDCVYVSDHETCVPSTLKETPAIVPAGVACEPTFLTTAEKVIGVPALAVLGE